MNQNQRTSLILFIILLCIVASGAALLWYTMQENIPEDLQEYFNLNKKELRLAINRYNTNNFFMLKLGVNMVYNCNCKYFLIINTFFVNEHHCKKILNKRPIKAIDKWIQSILVKILNCGVQYNMRPHEDALIKYLTKGESMDEDEIKIKFLDNIKHFIFDILEENKSFYHVFANNM
ncbi:hypothetical protein COBT_003267 [Conglomerata obtusa]